MTLDPRERAELALALWDSLDDSQRETDLPVTAELIAEMDRRANEHMADPASSVPWSEVLRKAGAGR